MFNTYFNVRDVPYDLRNRILDPDFGRIDVGYYSVKNVGSRLWNDIPDYLKEKGKQLNFKKHIAAYYIQSYQQ